MASSTSGERPPWRATHSMACNPFHGFTRIPLGLQLRVKRHDQPISNIGLMILNIRGLSAICHDA